jgi:hypothetical protein
VPAELAEFDQMATASPESVRDQMATTLNFLD